MRTVAIAFLLWWSSALASAAPEAKKSWEFSVLLDGSPIGYHHFELLPRESGLEVRSEAQFDVRFLFFNAYKYRHTNREIWDGECLRLIESKTRQNGKRFAVSGERNANGLILEANGREDRLDGCVMSFAYWNPDFLDESRLLDPQSGEYLSVDVEALGSQEVEVRGESVVATAYELRARNIKLTLWYSQDDEWLGLESVAEGGRIIRYVLT